MSAECMLGSYRLIADLGHGGMADVFLAAAEGPLGSGFTKLAVVKKLRSHLAEDPEFIAMLMDEARITARLSHPNVVQLFELGRADDDYFLAMEFLHGQPLHRVSRRVARSGAAFPYDVYYSIVSDVLAGLHHAHELMDYDGRPLDIAHRDVTPHNVFVTYDGAVKVLDFGIAKAAGRACVTQVGTVKGKVRYMSPEQASGAPVDRRTDIFAAGVILWNAATGSSFAGEGSDADVVRTLTSGEYVASPRALFPDVPEAIDAICRKALAFRPEERYATADEMRADLEAYLGRGRTDARKKLAGIMKDLFETDRAKLRAVLETSELTRSASLEVLGAPRAASPRENAPVAQEPAAAPPPAVPAPMPREPRGRHRSVLRVAGTLVLAAAAGLLLTVAARHTMEASPLQVAVAVPGVVVSDLTTISNDVRSKAESPRESPATAVVRKISVARRNAVATGSAAHGEETASSNGPSPTEAAPATSEGKRPTRKRSGLDTADPWGSSDARR